MTINYTQISKEKSYEIILNKSWVITKKLYDFLINFLTDENLIDLDSEIYEEYLFFCSENYEDNKKNPKNPILETIKENNYKLTDSSLFLEMNEDEVFEIAKIIANESPNQLTYYFKNYWINKYEYRLELAKIVYSISPRNSSTFFKNFDLEFYDKIKILKLALNNDKLVLKEIWSYDLWLTSFENQNLANVKDFLSFVSINFDSYKILWFTQEKLTLLINISKDTKLDNLIFLFIQLLDDNNDDIENIKITKELKKIDYLYLKWFGFSKEFIDKFLQKKLSNNLKQDFYIQCNRIKQEIWTNFFNFFNFDEKLLDNWLENLSNFLSLILTIKNVFWDNLKNNNQYLNILLFSTNHLLLDINTLKSDTKDNINNLLIWWFASNLANNSKIIVNINSNNITKIIDFYKGVLDNLLLSSLKSDENENLSWVLDLNNSWWEINVLISLFWTYNSLKNNYNDVFLFYLKIFKTLLSWWNQKFLNAKYHWFDNDNFSKELSNRQLVWLDKDQLEKWKSNPSHLSYIWKKEDLNFTQEEIFEMVHGEFMTKFFYEKHINNIKDWLLDELWKFDKQKYFKQIELVESFISEKMPIDKAIDIFLNLWENDWFSNENLYILLSKILIIKAREVKNFDDFKYIIYFLKNGIWKEIDLSWINYELIKISKMLSPLENWKDAIVFTTIFDDPKMMFEIWTLVKTDSCLNYITWFEHLPSLLWYWIDANTKWLISYVITENNCSDFNIIKSQIQNWNVNYNFNPTKRILEINWINIQLKSWVSRRMLKLWKSELWPSLFLEKQYFSPHYAIDIVDDEQKSLVSEFSKDVWLKILNTWIKFIWSKNPWGNYSDVTRKSQRSDYTI